MDDIMGTQAFNFDETLSSENEEPARNTNKRKVGELHFENKISPIYIGTNTIGRDITCNVYISNLTVSMNHAEIEADSDNSVFLLNISRNGTMLNKTALKSNRSYQVFHNNVLKFGKAVAVYKSCSHNRNSTSLTDHRANESVANTSSVQLMQSSNTIGIHDALTQSFQSYQREIESKNTNLKIPDIDDTNETIKSDASSNTSGDIFNISVAETQQFSKLTNTSNITKADNKDHSMNMEANEIIPESDSDGDEEDYFLQNVKTHNFLTPLRVGNIAKKCTTVSNNISLNSTNTLADDKEKRNFNEHISNEKSVDNSKTDFHELQTQRLYNTTEIEDNDEFDISKDNIIIDDSDEEKSIQDTQYHNRNNPNIHDLATQIYDEQNRNIEHANFPTNMDVSHSNSNNIVTPEKMEAFLREDQRFKNMHDLATQNYNEQHKNIEHATVPNNMNVSHSNLNNVVAPKKVEAFPRKDQRFENVQDSSDSETDEEGNFTQHLVENNDNTNIVKEKSCEYTSHKKDQEEQTNKKILNACVSKDHRFKNVQESSDSETDKEGNFTQYLEENNDNSNLVKEKSCKYTSHKKDQEKQTNKKISNTFVTELQKFRNVQDSSDSETDGEGHFTQHLKENKDNFNLVKEKSCEFTSHKKEQEKQTNKKISNMFVTELQRFKNVQDSSDSETDEEGHFTQHLKENNDNSNFIKEESCEYTSHKKEQANEKILNANKSKNDSYDNIQNDKSLTKIDPKQATKNNEEQEIATEIVEGDSNCSFDNLLAPEKLEAFLEKSQRNIDDTKVNIVAEKTPRKNEIKLKKDEEEKEKIEQENEELITGESKNVTPKKTETVKKKKMLDKNSEVYMNLFVISGKKQEQKSATSDFNEDICDLPTQILENVNNDVTNDICDLPTQILPELQKIKEEGISDMDSSCLENTTQLMEEKLIFLNSSDSESDFDENILISATKPSLAIKEPEIVIDSEETELTQLLEDRNDIKEDTKEGNKSNEKELLNNQLLSRNEESMVEKNMQELFDESQSTDFIPESTEMLTQQLVNILQCTQVDSTEDKEKSAELENTLKHKKKTIAHASNDIKQKKSLDLQTSLQKCSNKDTNTHISTESIKTNCGKRQIESSSDITAERSKKNHVSKTIESTPKLSHLQIILENVVERNSKKIKVENEQKLKATNSKIQKPKSINANSRKNIGNKNNKSASQEKDETETSATIKVETPKSLNNTRPRRNLKRRIIIEEDSTNETSFGENSQEVESISNVSHSKAKKLKKSTAKKLDESNDMGIKNSVPEADFINNVTLRKRKINDSINSSLKRKNSNITATLSSPRKNKFKVLFTGIDNEKWKDALKNIGINEANSVSACTMLVTDKIRRTAKFLCAISMGKPIISINWLKDSIKAGTCLDINNYALKDVNTEKQFGFSLQTSLENAREHKLLKGYAIVLLPKIKTPPLSDLKDMIQSCEGRVLTSVPRRWPAKAIVIAPKNDLEDTRKVLKNMPKRVTVQSEEFILTGLLFQKLDFNSFKLNVF